MTYGILASSNSLVLPIYLEALKPFSHLISCIIIDGKIDDRIYTEVLQRYDGLYRPKTVDEANSTGIPVVHVDNHNGPASLQIVSDRKIDYLINGGTIRIIKKALLESVKGVINCHPGLLPQYRGCSCVEWSIYNGDPVGASAHLMSEKIDEGPVIFSAAMDVDRFQPYTQIRYNMLFHQGRVLAEAISRLEESAADAIAPYLPEAGTYHKTMPAELLEQTKSKIKAGEYSSKGTI